MMLLDGVDDMVCPPRPLLPYLMALARRCRAVRRDVHRVSRAFGDAQTGPSGMTGQEEETPETEAHGPALSNLPRKTCFSAGLVIVRRVGSYSAMDAHNRPRLSCDAAPHGANVTMCMERVS